MFWHKAVSETEAVHSNLCIAEKNTTLTGVYSSPVFLWLWFACYEQMQLVFCKHCIL